MTVPQELPERCPEPGELVAVRSRRWLVEEIVPALRPGESPIVRLACAEDDCPGEEAEVFWEHEIDRRICRLEDWAELAGKGFDTPRRFGAFLHALRWNSITATDPDLFQAPFRAGIKLDAYQMEPLRKALRMPRVNLFIADDTGLGKTIEAGLIARELLLRQKAKTIVISAPSSVLEQWQAEMEERFGLLFAILDRSFLARMRRERGFGVNPWRTHSRFLISHRLLIDPIYTDPMRAWLGKSVLPGSLLILDEAHHAAPSSGGNYGIESKFTRAVRDLSGRFEHRLFLSATPHNGHSNSFSTLLELLDPNRFTRGVRIRPKALDAVMVRRIKEDIRGLQGGFPRRRVERVVLDGLPPDAPELVLSRLLDAYRNVRNERFAGAPKHLRTRNGLLMSGLQQRLLSSVEAFARSLAQHRKTVERQRRQATAEAAEAAAPAEVEAPAIRHDEAERFVSSAALADGESDGGGALPPEVDDDALDMDLDAARQAAQQEEDRLVARIGSAVESVAAAADIERREDALLDEMEQAAQAARGQPDAKTRHLIDWIREHLCPGLPAWGKALPPGAAPPQWNQRRLLIFTENREGTKRYVQLMLEAAIESSDRAGERLLTIDGLVQGPRRREIQRRFNTRPADEPLRILLATDAAREGLNFQAQCTDLFHFDLPWNPGRIEQRNGRIDRKLQPADEVRCHYFVLPQRAEDRVLEVLVKKTETIRNELGSLSRVIEDDIERRLNCDGIRHDTADRLGRKIARHGLDPRRQQAVERELETARKRRRAELDTEIGRCRRLLEQSRRWVRFDPEAFRDALSCSLELAGAGPLEPAAQPHGDSAWRFPDVSGPTRTDPSWQSTLDSLRRPLRPGQKVAEWRQEEPVRPIVFQDAGVLTDEVVHLHLSQRVARRLLGRFSSQGFVHHDLSRACLVQAEDAIPRVVLLGRLMLYGRGAERLHEEIVAVAARWTDGDRRRDERLRPYARDAQARSLDLLDRALGNQLGDDAGQPVGEVVEQRLLRSAPADIEDLRGHLKDRARALEETARKRLAERGEQESRDLRQTLKEQRAQVRRELDEREQEEAQQVLAFSREEERQLRADIRFWRERLKQFDQDIDTQPAKVRAFYEVQAVPPVEPLGIVYLWPASN